METNPNEAQTGGAEESPSVMAGETVDNTAVAEGAGMAGQLTPVAPEGDYNDSGVPNFDYVRNRIESRFATATGAIELAEDSSQAASLDQQMEERDRAGREKLEQIRRSMRGE
jgi:phage shock protein A